jgi:SSS family solute:Na+ symporter
MAARFQSLVARGAMKDIGSGVSLLLGVLSTQTYAQAIWSAETDKKAKQGALLSALLIPPLGLAGISIGLFMRAHYLLQAEVEALKAAGQAVPQMPVIASTIQVFPAFVLNHLPPLFAGIVLGTLLITSVGGGAGLSLGMATILVKDIVKKVTDKFNDAKKELMITRATLGGILVIAAVIAALVPSSTINDLGFLSMGLRGSVVLMPMSFALWVKGPVDRKWILAAIVLAPAAVLAGKLAALPIDSLYLGIAVSALCCVMGRVFGKKEAAI